MTKETESKNHVAIVQFNFDRETKGAVRYQEVDAGGQPKTNDNGAVIGTLYIRKSALNGTVPKSLRCHIDATG